MQLTSKQIIEAAMNGEGGGGTLVSATARSNTYSSPLQYNLGIRGSAELMTIGQEDSSLLTVLNDGYYKIDLNLPQGRNSSSGGVTIAKIIRIDKDGVEEELGDDSLGANNWSSAILIINAWSFLNAGDKLRVDYVVSGTTIQHQPSLTLTTVAGTDSTLLPPVIHSGKLVSAKFASSNAVSPMEFGMATGYAGLASPTEGADGVTVEATGYFDVMVGLSRMRAEVGGDVNIVANVKLNGVIVEAKSYSVQNGACRDVMLGYSGHLTKGDVITVEWAESSATIESGSYIKLQTVIDGESTHLREYPYQGTNPDNTFFPVGSSLMAWMEFELNDRQKLMTQTSLYCWTGTTAIYLTEGRTEQKGPKLEGVWALTGELADVEGKTTGMFMRIR